MTRKNNQHCSYQTHSYRFRFYKVITSIGLSILFFFITPGSFAQVPDTMVEDIAREIGLPRLRGEVQHRVPQRVAVGRLDLDAG